MKKPKTRGRPVKTEGMQRENVLRIRLTDEERAKLDSKAATRTLDTSTWARMVLLDEASRNHSS
jgi:hypothetical protein